MHAFPEHFPELFHQCSCSCIWDGEPHHNPPLGAAKLINSKVNKSCEVNNPIGCNDLNSAYKRAGRRRRFGQIWPVSYPVHHPSPKQESASA